MSKCVVNLLVCNHELTSRVEALTQQFEWFKRQFFGSKSERRPELSEVRQMFLGEWVQPKTVEPTITVPEHRRRASVRRDDDDTDDSGLRFDPSVPVEVVRIPTPKLEDMATHRVILAAAVLAWVTGCASVMSPQGELHDVAEGQGVVIGSLLLTVEDEAPYDTHWYITFDTTGPGRFNPFATVNIIPVEPGRESIFIRKMRAGIYVVGKLEEGKSSRNRCYTVRSTFNVRAGLTSYIGKLSIHVPGGVPWCHRYRLPVSVADAQDDTIEKLRNQHQSVPETVVKDLATP